MNRRALVLALRTEEYRDDWVDRLAIVLAAFEQMEPGERDAALRYLASRYRLMMGSDPPDRDLPTAEDVRGILKPD